MFNHCDVTALSHLPQWSEPVTWEGIQDVVTTIYVSIYKNFSICGNQKQHYLPFLFYTIFVVHIHKASFVLTITLYQTLCFVSAQDLHHQSAYRGSSLDSAALLFVIEHLSL